MDQLNQIVNSVIIVDDYRNFAIVNLIAVQMFEHFSLSEGGLNKLYCFAVAPGNLPVSREWYFVFNDHC